MHFSVKAWLECTFSLMKMFSISEVEAIFTCFVLVLYLFRDCIQKIGLSCIKMLTSLVWHNSFLLFRKKSVWIKMFPDRCLVYFPIFNLYIIINLFALLKKALHARICVVILFWVAVDAFLHIVKLLVWTHNAV